MSRLAMIAAATALLLLLVVMLAWSGGAISTLTGNSDDDGPGGDRAEQLLVTVFDVGQAQAVGVIAPTGEAMLIEAGRSGSTIEETVVPYFEARGVTSLQYFVLSHPDQDHIGGAPQLLTLMPVDVLLDPVIPSTNQSYAETLEIALDLEIDARIARSGDEISLSEDVSAEILWPQEPLLESAGEVETNENSVVVRLVYDDTAIFIPGDIGHEAEELLVELAPESLRSDVLVVGHHGSAGSSSGLFLDAVDPHVAVISAGINNPYGHPTDEVVRRLRLHGIDIYRTDLDGTIEIYSDGDDVAVELPDQEGDQ